MDTDGPTADASRGAERGGDRGSPGATATITLGEATTLLQHEPGNGASAEVLAALSRLDPEAVLVLAEVVKDELQIIYERRATLRSSATGLDHLVRNLREERTPTVLLGYVDLGEALVYLFLSDPPARLLGCVVGSDRRRFSSHREPSTAGRESSGRSPASVRPDRGGPSPWCGIFPDDVRPDP